MKAIIKNRLIDSIQKSFEAIPDNARKDLGDDQYIVAYREGAYTRAKKKVVTGLGVSTIHMLIVTDAYEEPPATVIEVNYFEDVRGPLGNRRIQDVSGIPQYELGIHDLARAAFVLHSFSKDLSGHEVTSEQARI